jgi:chemotaxis family two-component system sensor kinase Cph1
VTPTQCPDVRPPDHSSQQVVEWQRFLDAAVHDLRASLRAIGTSTELLQEVCAEGLGEEAKPLIVTILEGVAKIESFSQAVASYSQALQSNTSTWGLVRSDSALRAALTELKQQIADGGAIITHGPLPRARGSHEQLTVLFRALISNALLCRGTEPPIVHVSAQRENEQWHFAVRDNGVGIDRKYWDQIFQPFQRLYIANHPQGIGLGLTICRKIVEAHGGTIWVESQLQKGSTFIFTLPAETTLQKPCAGFTQLLE